MVNASIRLPPSVNDIIYDLFFCAYTNKENPRKRCQVSVCNLESTIRMAFIVDYRPSWLLMF